MIGLERELIKEIKGHKTMYLGHVYRGINNELIKLIMKVKQKTVEDAIENNGSC